MRFLAAVLLILAHTASASKSLAFLNWMKSNGARFHGISLQKYPGMGFGVLATRQIAEDEVVLELPRSLALCRETLEKDPLLSHYRTFPIIDDAMVAWLLLNREIGDESSFHPYFQMLPAKISICQLFGQQELDALQSPYHAQLCSQSRANEASTHERFLAPFRTLTEKWCESHSDSTRCPLDADVSFEQYLWAKSVLWSRAWTVAGKRWLVPLADMFNYSPSPSAPRVAARGADFLRTHSVGEGHESWTGDDGDGVIRLKSDRACGSGEQLFEDYGDNRNIIYLMNHGFVPSQNPFNTHRFELSPDHPLLDHDKYSALRAISSRRGGEIEFGDTAYMERGAVQQLSNVALVMASSNETLRECVGNWQATKAEDATGAVLITCLEREWPSDQQVPVLDSIVPLAAHELNSFPTSLEEDEAFLEGLSGQPLMSIALRFRMALKRSLQTFIDMHSQASVETTTEVLVRQFNEWTERNRANFPVNDLRAVSDEQMRVGVVATRNISPEELYISIRPDILISEENAMKDTELSPVLLDLKSRFGSIDNFHAVLFLLLIERRKGPQSNWAPYIALLPQDLSHNPVMWARANMEELRGSALLGRIETRIGTIRSKFEKINELVFKTYPLFTWVAYEDYLWAHLILDSRAIWWNGKRHLVPVLDLINCIERVDGKVMRPHATTYNRQTGTADTLAPAAFPKESPVYENYGQANHVYFLYHGFMLDDNTKDCVLVDLSKQTGQGSTFECFAPGEFPQRVRAALSQVSSSASAEETLKQVIDSQLEQYPTTIQEDEEIMDQLKGVSDARAMAVKFRLGEKRMLVAVQQWLVESIEGARRHKDEL